MEHSNDFLGTERVGRLMGRYAVPCVISLLVGALYNIVDQIFIANADYLGSYGNAANTVVFPLTVVALAIAVMVGDGCCAFVSMALGPVFGQEQYAQIPMAVVGIVMKFFQIVISAVIIVKTYLASSPSLLECHYWFWRVSVSVRLLSPFLWHGFWVGCNLYFIFKRTKDD